MFTREEALALLAEKFPITESKYKTEVPGEFRTVIWDAERRLERDIDLHEPEFDGLKEGGTGLDEEGEKEFRHAVEIQYKDENGLPR